MAIDREGRCVRSTSSGDFMAENHAARVKQLMAAEAARVQAMIHKDYAVLDRLLADNLSYCHSSGRWDTKAGFIDNMKAGFSYLSSRRSDSAVRLFGATAIVTGSLDIILQASPTTPPDDIACLVTQTWMERNGGWQLVAHQATRRRIA
ncbi:nuclear transport factor 2 family protein [Rhizorhabdus wittichii]